MTEPAQSFDPTEPTDPAATTSKAIGRLGAISLDCGNPVELAGFYADLLGLKTIWESDDFVALAGAPVLMTFQHIEGYRRPDWPADRVPKQIHLEIAVFDLDVAERDAVARGALAADPQPEPEKWRVLIDPAGHPFCVTTLIPEF